MRAYSADCKAPDGRFAARRPRQARRHRAGRTTRGCARRSTRSIVSKGVRTRRVAPICGGVTPASVTSWQSSYARTSTTRQRAPRTRTCCEICIAHQPLACRRCRAENCAAVESTSYITRAAPGGTRGKRCAGIVLVFPARREAANDGFEAGLFRIVDTPLVVQRASWLGSNGDDG